ncbi:hypothetical protein LZ31DRAFT_192167 [Colletotrichum somersetense]|nr:hypothetical protein LZ31DRAFT_192167 [Colletotrichum somersetense]
MLNHRLSFFRSASLSLDLTLSHLLKAFPTYIFVLSSTDSPVTFTLPVLSSENSRVAFRERSRCNSTPPPPTSESQRTSSTISPGNNTCYSCADPRLSISASHRESKQEEKTTDSD